MTEARSIPRYDAIELATAFASGAALSLASLANLLTYNDYPFFRPEVGLVVLGLLTICAIMAPFYCSQRRWGRSLLDGCLAMLFADLNTPWPAASVAFGLIVAVISWRSKISLAGPMALIGSFIFLTIVLGLGRENGWIKDNLQGGNIEQAQPPDKPVILHLILDEHIGIEGFRERDPDAPILQQQLKSFYGQAGFVVYGGAYSEQMHTANAIPYMLNYGHRTRRHGGKDGVKVGPAEHLEKLAHSGYRITVFQSDFAELCAGNRVQRCVTYDSSSLRPTIALPLATTERAKLIVWKFISLSDFMLAALSTAADLGDLSGRNGEHLRQVVDAGPRSSTAASLTALDLLTAQLRTAKPGDAFIAHILLPHVPYMVGSDCTFLPRSEWGYRHTPTNIDKRRAAYRNQVRCTTHRVAKALRALDQSPAGKNAIVIIHGDHGSRITDIDTNEPNVGRFGDDDLIATFSTLLVLKAPNVQPRYFADRQPVAAILREFATSDFRTAPEPSRQNIKGLYLDDLNWVIRRQIPLPSSWIAPSPSQHGNVGGNTMTAKLSADKSERGDR